ncbi:MULTISPECIES: mannose-6-phosphate isomerase, class I [Gordonia]|uniref:mannose-6-phosphate isomerase, class I n=1 Tax=Gordonia TaxID=2053 RepID=UPI000586E92D|nr:MULTISPECIES: mannose-6-phosphate isomerase, class I [Gordonia]MDH3010767.1 mannose-6-phosphate isomerase, class I [Gordonia alkanivorans]MDH3020217.1 mannose-6-phosphate isomerase, class I [Gordonia alkanivorans]OLT42856.1 mannose-6-phosphate isomerase, class I [Gordonia sp. CNJ-863]QGP89012.1 mannose-6-phosphate isomerase, class I [Gordonia sp. 135]
MRILDGVVRPYAWGSRTAIASIQGRPVPSAHPEAELWFGSHPAGSARCVDPSGPEQHLVEVIDADPVATLGAASAAEFGNRLPFLLKILAAEEALSLQAHPSADQAREGFERENARGLALDARDRNYRDPWHKPELIVATTPFDALAGFRDPHKTVALLRELQVSELDHYLGMLAGQPDSEGLRAVFTTWLTLPESSIRQLVPAVLHGAIEVLSAGRTEFSAELRTVCELGEDYPNDPGVLASLLLNHVHLEPGQGLYLPAGNLHAYLRGTGVEIMANSDNVLRGGLTPKHIDVPELLRVLDFTPVDAAQMAPPVRMIGAERVYLTPAPEFRLSRIELDGTGLHHSSSICFDMPGPQILAVLSGAVEVRPGDGAPLTVKSGHALWITDDDPDVIVRAASARAVFYRALVPVAVSATEGVSASATAAATATE